MGKARECCWTKEAMEVRQEGWTEELDAGRSKRKKQDGDGRRR
jgi:hypothetical protein